MYTHKYEGWVLLCVFAVSKSDRRAEYCGRTAFPKRKKQSILYPWHCLVLITNHWVTEYIVIFVTTRSIDDYNYTSKINQMFDFRGFGSRSHLPHRPSRWNDYFYLLTVLPDHFQHKIALNCSCSKSLQVVCRGPRWGRPGCGCLLTCFVWGIRNKIWTFTNQVPLTWNPTVMNLFCWF